MRNLSLDYLKVLLSFFVVFLHTGFLYDFSSEIGYLFVNGIFRVAVPIFFIINGYYFYDIRDKFFLFKWMKRVFILYFVWTIIYLPVIIFNSNFFKIIENFLIGYFILWYLVALLIAGVSLFLLRKVSNKFLLTLAFLLFIAGYLIQSLGNAHIYSGQIDDLLNWVPASRNFLFFALPFMVIGFIIRKIDFKIKFRYNLGFFILLLMVLLSESYVNYILTSEPVDLLLSLFFLCPFVFILFNNFIFMGKSKNIANFSTGIFLIHPYIIFFIKFIYEVSNTYLSILTIILSCLVSVFLVKLNEKIKILL